MEFNSGFKGLKEDRINSSFLKIHYWTTTQ